MAYAPWATDEGVCCEATCIVAINTVSTPAYYRPLATNASLASHVRRRRFVFYAQRLRVDAALSLADAFGSRCQRSDNRQKSAASRAWGRDVLLCGGFLANRQPYPTTNQAWPCV